jgi:hypothetical protein
MYRFAWREHRSVPFLATFVLLHLVCSAGIVAGGVVGAAKWIVSPRYRRLFAPLAEPATARGAGAG